MNFKINEKVIYCPYNADITNEEVSPIVLFKGVVDKNLSTIFYHSKETNVPVETIRKYIPCLDIEDQFSSEILVIVDMIQSTWKSIFKNQEIKIQTSNDSIEFEGFSISPCTYRSRTLTGVREFLGYELIEWKHQPATRDEPENIYDHPIAKCRTKVQAVSKLIKLVIGNQIDNYLEYLTMIPEDELNYED